MFSPEHPPLHPYESIEQSINECFADIRTLLSQRAQGDENRKIEIECRLGYFDGGKFVVGIPIVRVRNKDDKYLSRIRLRLADEFSKEKTIYVEDYVVDDPNASSKNKKLRLRKIVEEVVDPNPATAFEWDKRRKASIDGTNGFISKETLFRRDFVLRECIAFAKTGIEINPLVALFHVGLRISVSEEVQRPLFHLEKVNHYRFKHGVSLKKENFRTEVFFVYESDHFKDVLSDLFYPKIELEVEIDPSSINDPEIAKKGLVAFFEAMNRFLSP